MLDFSLPVDHQFVRFLCYAEMKRQNGMVAMTVVVTADRWRGAESGRLAAGGPGAAPLPARFHVLSDVGHARPMTAKPGMMC